MPSFSTGVACLAFAALLAPSALANTTDLAATPAPANTEAIGPAPAPPSPRIVSPSARALLAPYSSFSTSSPGAAPRPRSPWQQDDVSAADRLTKAIDSTATQWSFQLAYQAMDYKSGTVDGQPRPTGNDNFLQLRIVAPIPKSDTIPITLLPRLTLRHLEAPTGETGFDSTELFVLGIAQDWGTGRWGLGPLVEIPGSVGSSDLGYGLAGAIVNASGDWFYGVLLTQAWQTRDPSLDETGIAPLGIAPFLNYQVGGGWYLGNGDMVIRYDWDSSSIYVPIGLRLGKVLVGKKSSWNLYVEYQTSLIYDDWPGSAVDNSLRLNATFTLPVGL